MKDNESADYSGFSLVSGGLIYSLTSVFRGKGDEKKGRIRTAIVLAAITWVPLCIIALFEGTLKDSSQTINFFEDFAMHTRLIFAVPFLILIENIVESAFLGYVKNSDSIIPNTQQDAFNRLVKKLDVLTNSYIPEILGLVLIYGLIYIDWGSLPVFSSGRNYLIQGNSKTLSIGGWYYLFFCSPIFQLLIFRWIWRWIIWVYSIIRISQFSLHVDSLHADRMGGLEYLNSVPMAFVFCLVAPSAYLAAFVGIDIVYHGALLTKYLVPLSMYVIFLPVLIFTPLLLFTPVLMKARFYSVQDFGNLIRRHNRTYKEVWINGDGEKGEKLLGSADHSSLADINTGYAPVKEMQLISVGLKQLLLGFAVNVLPFVPLVFTYYSASNLYHDLLKFVFHG